MSLQVGHTDRPLLLQILGSSADGVQALQRTPVPIIQSLVALIRQPSTSYEAILAAVDTISGVWACQPQLCFYIHAVHCLAVNANTRLGVQNTKPAAASRSME
jgi:hypothetical protein